jgi:ABC-2 type transport system permease protein
MCAMLIIQLWFYVFGLAISQIMRRIKSTMPTTLAAVFGFFAVGMLGAILNEQSLRYVSPFRFFDFVGIASGKGYEVPLVVTACLSMIAAWVLSYVIYTKRDIKAVA